MKTKYTIKYLLALVLIFQISFAATCGGSSSKVRQLAKVEDDVAQGLLSVATILRDGKANGTISQEDIDFLKPLLIEIGNTNKQAIVIGRSLSDPDNIPIDKQSQLLQMISLIADTLTTLNNEGTLRIKDPDKRILFSALVLAIQTSVTSVITILNIQGVKK